MKPKDKKPMMKNSLPYHNQAAVYCINNTLLSRLLCCMHLKLSLSTAPVETREHFVPRQIDPCVYLEGQAVWAAPVWTKGTTMMWRGPWFKLLKDPATLQQCPPSQDSDESWFCDSTQTTEPTVDVFARLPMCRIISQSALPGCFMGITVHTNKQLYSNTIGIYNMSMLLESTFKVILSVFFTHYAYFKTLVTLLQVLLIEFIATLWYFWLLIPV